MIDKSQVVFGIRAVIEAIESGKQVDKVLMKKDLGGELARELLSVTREYNVPVQRVPVERINKVTRKNHQGVIAFMAAVDYYHVDDIVPALYDEGINPLVVVLDGVTDVRNFGAIARTCECAGVNCIVIPERNSVSVNADAVKTSAGALNYLPVCRERNLVKAVQYLRDSGFKVMGASGKTDLNYTKADFTGPVAIVLGAEDTGISTDVLKLCDTLVAIPEFGQINSLNVSVAGGIMIYEVVRQRLNDGQNVNS
ncbi:MAG: 23S rRNA (guanosine(2251)-2'-O)-methyltransferase RlmB [Bacteroidales bacterium]|nr:23S rRNA (guanosine(2251)-2'-O)-methyltransferase RlmB [Bacteroidales bacterium]MDD7229371.1 23S rRNA (guanosine(2251)-2'-O)-methyltransferase RlmB [Bacteroidales bacterium]MDD7748564.1 23S rRNA (guanosine(2251)-2'-O)-methyltransferase RlmB [Bacteroidales bacterium]MDY2710680.1 23S rRNA (guanosine(2251)-2'-O)-methyltransferase RlmB [Sodaliphilus sp.]MDY4141126.1 23S rRNA (guanosine(2251)-2'-O)-methyltransferase RlmB [Sodaliphilus sp.]